VGALRDMTGTLERTDRAAAAVTIALPPLTTVAHDLRGPLQALALSAELLLESVQEPGGAPDATQVARLAGTMQRQVVWLQGLVENLHAATALQAGSFTISPHPTDLREIVAGVEPVVLPLLAHKAQALEIVRPPTLPLVAADGRRIGQALVNLLLNASKYSPPGRPITISLRACRGHVRVEVADRGPGLPPGAVEGLFTPFTRAPEARQGAVEGMGLGLAIVHEVVAAHGGRVGAGPRRGGGARFWFALSALPALSLERTAALDLDGAGAEAERAPEADCRLTAY
jgi:two-component system sensor histidine kinase KdpD